MSGIWCQEKSGCRRRRGRKSSLLLNEPALSHTNRLYLMAKNKVSNRSQELQTRVHARPSGASGLRRGRISHCTSTSICRFDEKTLGRPSRERLNEEQKFGTDASVKHMVCAQLAKNPQQQQLWNRFVCDSLNCFSTQTSVSDAWSPLGSEPAVRLSLGLCHFIFIIF